MISLSKTQLAKLRRLFVHEWEGKQVIGNNVTTNAGNTSLRMLYGLKRKGVITFEEEGYGSRVFGITMWKVLLTDLGNEALRDSP